MLLSNQQEEKGEALKFFFDNDGLRHQVSTMQARDTDMRFVGASWAAPVGIFFFLLACGCESHQLTYTYARAVGPYWACVQLMTRWKVGSVRRCLVFDLAVLTDPAIQLWTGSNAAPAVSGFSTPWAETHSETKCAEIETSLFQLACSYQICSERSVVIVTLQLQVQHTWRLQLPRLAIAICDLCTNHGGRPPLTIATWRPV